MKRFKVLWLVVLFVILVSCIPRVVIQEVKIPVPVPCPEPQDISKPVLIPIEAVGPADKDGVVCFQEQAMKNLLEDLGLMMKYKSQLEEQRKGYKVDR